MHNYGPAIYFENLLVGLFEEGVLPSTEGAYRYVPTRGPGHLKLVQHLQTGSSADCHYATGDERVFFKVTGIPSHQTVQLTALRREPAAQE
jgi:hypothetical protein